MYDLLALVFYYYFVFTLLEVAGCSMLEAEGCRADMNWLPGKTVLNYSIICYSLLIQAFQGVETAFFWDFALDTQHNSTRWGRPRLSTDCRVKQEQRHKALVDWRRSGEMPVFPPIFESDAVMFETRFSTRWTTSCQDKSRTTILITISWWDSNTVEALL